MSKRQIQKVSNKLLKRMEKTLDEEEKIECRDFKSITGALKELREIQREDEDKSSGDNSLVVRFVGETEEMSY